jgi:hypothetical protein
LGARGTTLGLMLRLHLLNTLTAQIQQPSTMDNANTLPTPPPRVAVRATLAEEFETALAELANEHVRLAVASAQERLAAAEELMEPMVALLMIMQPMLDNIRLRANKFITDTGSCFHSGAECKNSKTLRLVANAPLRLRPCRHCIQA